MDGCDWWGGRRWPTTSRGVSELSGLPDFDDRTIVVLLYRIFRAAICGKLGIRRNASVEVLH